MIVPNSGVGITVVIQGDGGHYLQDNPYVELLDVICNSLDKLTDCAKYIITTLLFVTFIPTLLRHMKWFALFVSLTQLHRTSTCIPCTIITQQ